jgi:hypothetical protein
VYDAGNSFVSSRNALRILKTVEQFRQRRWLASKNTNGQPDSGLTLSRFSAPQKDSAHAGPALRDRGDS